MVGESLHIWYQLQQEKDDILERRRHIPHKYEDTRVGILFTQGNCKCNTNHFRNLLSADSIKCSNKHNRKRTYLTGFVQA